MKILAIECSASPVSAAVLQDGKIISNDFQNVKVTHSQTLLPMIDKVLTEAGLSLKDIVAFAAAAGPGSFTGVRIGISAVKGMAAPHNKPCFPVSTLFAMAMRFLNEDAIICPVMDARCNQLYNALFRVKNGNIERLCEDRAVICDDLIGELSGFDEKIIVTGDGHRVFYPLADKFKNIVLADEERLYQNAIGVAFAAHSGAVPSVLPQNLLPVYLRLPQAERELKEKRKLK